MSTKVAHNQLLQAQAMRSWFAGTRDCEGVGLSTRSIEDLCCKNQDKEVRQNIFGGSTTYFVHPLFVHIVRGIEDKRFTPTSRVGCCVMAMSSF